MKYLLAIIALTAIQMGPVYATETSDEEVQAIREQLLELSRRLDQLEQSNRLLAKTNTELKTANRQTAASVVEYTEKIDSVVTDISHQSDAIAWAQGTRIEGDFRFRLENIDPEGGVEIDRQRVRARASVIANPLKNIELGLGFASGNEDPVSTNQTLESGGTTKGMNMDLAYFKWSSLANTKITAGKFKNILFTAGGNPMLYDSDWRPEGIGLEWGDGGFFANLMVNWVGSDSKDSGTASSYIAQGGIKSTFAADLHLTAGLSYSKFETAGRGSFFGDEDDFFGNSFDPLTNTYIYNYEELELFADLSFSLFDRPASVFVDYVQNQDTNVFDTGYAFGFTLGSAKDAGAWSLGWLYMDIEADAVFGLLTDSDFGGGGTDDKGHLLSGSYAIAKNWNANFTYFLNQVDDNLGVEKDYDRLQLDLSFKY